MASQYDVEPYDPCPCGSGAKYKFCCAAKAKDLRHGKYPMGTVAYYGPDDKTTTKIAAGVILRENGEPTLRRWTGEGVRTDAKVAEEIKRYFAEHGVKTIVSVDEIIGCPHEEGIDFAMGADCPMCPFWAGKQRPARRGGPGVNLWDAREYDEYDDDDDDDDDDDEDSDDLEVDEIDDEEDSESEERDWDAQFARVEAILGDAELDFDQALAILLADLKAKLVLPCEVKGSEDFNWEEPYVLGGWSPAEYKRLRKTQPSYTDRFQLLSIGAEEDSEWTMFDEDIRVRARRVSDGKEFILGVAELKATDKKSANYQLIDDYGVWFVNNR
jgi:hypothetical protein